MAPRIETGAAWLLLLAGAGMLALAGYGFFAPPPGPALHVEREEFELTEAVAGERREVVLRLDNRSGRPLRVLGVGFC